MVDGLSLNEAIEASIRIILVKEGVTSPESELNYRIMDLAIGNKFNPIEEWQKALPKWDGKNRLKELVSYFSFDDTIENSQILTPERKFEIFLGKAYKRWVEDSPNEFICLIIVGDQGHGKSHFASWLCPLKRYFTEVEVQEFGSKDYTIKSSENLLLCLNEFEAVSSYNQALIKEAITKLHAKVRKPYRRDAEQVILKGVLIGTANTAQFMNDSKNRRYIPLQLSPEKDGEKSIDWGYKSIDYDQFWSQIKENYVVYEKMTKEEVIEQYKGNLYCKEETPVANVLEEGLTQESKKDGVDRRLATPATLLRIVKEYGIPIGGNTSRQIASFIKEKYGVTSKSIRVGEKVERAFPGIYIM